MTTLIHHEQDVFAPTVELQSVVAGFEPEAGIFAPTPCADTASKLTRDAARHRNCRMRAIETLRRPGRSLSA